MLTVVNRLGTGKAGIGGRAYNYLVIGEILLQFIYKNFRGIDLTDADSMDPNAFFGRFISKNSAKPFTPAAAVAIMPDHAVNDLRAYRHQGQQIYAVKHVFHIGFQSTIDAPIILAMD